MNYRWTKTEIDWFVEYENQLNDLEGGEPERIIFLQAKLLISNKYLVGYVNGVRQKDLYCFNESLAWEKHYVQRGMIFTTHPINFPNEKEYVAFLSMNTDSDKRNGLKYE